MGIDGDLVDTRHLEKQDAWVASHLAARANRTTRRTFLAWAGRASLALMGGSFINLWQSESAWAACGGGPKASRLGHLVCAAFSPETTTARRTAVVVGGRLAPR